MYHHINIAVYTTPANRTTYALKWAAGELSNKGIKVSFWSRQIDENVWESLQEEYLIGYNFEREFIIPVPFVAKTDVEMRVVGLQSDSSASGNFEGY